MKLKRVKIVANAYFFGQLLFSHSINSKHTETVIFGRCYELVLGR
jgi:hypothetical protein